MDDELLLIHLLDSSCASLVCEALTMRSCCLNIEAGIAMEGEVASALICLPGRGWCLRERAVLREKWRSMVKW